MIKYKIIHSTTYVRRDLYLLEIDGKFIQVYRSSGLSVTGHVHKMIPFLGLNTRQTMSTHIGYIIKEMFYGGRYVSHHKYLEDYPGVQELMEELHSLPKPTEEFDLDLTIDMHDELDRLTQFCKEYNKKIDELTNNIWLDLKQ